MSLPRALLLGGTGRLPFNGHLRLRALGDGASLSVAGRVAAGLPPDEAWRAVVALHGALAGTRGKSALEMLAGARVALEALDPALLGPARGGDLSLLLVASGPDGDFYAAHKLDAIWSAELRPLVPPTDSLPLPAPAGAIFGRCAGDGEVPEPGRLLAQCGVRP